MRPRATAERPNLSTPPFTMEAKHMRVTLIALFFLSLLAAGPAAAQTADGLPPSVEVTCAKTQECAFGICNSYCEAGDCHCYYDPGCEPSISQTACDQLAGHYRDATGQDPPCDLAAQCPCLDDDNWPTQSNTWFQFISGAILPQNCSDNGNELAVSAILSDGLWAASVDSANNRCQIQNPNLDSGVDSLTGLSDDQTAACRQLLEDATSTLCGGSASFCGDGTCDLVEDACSCSADCGSPPATEVGLCSDGEDNDCDGNSDCTDTDCVGDAACTGSFCGDGICDSSGGEDQCTCSFDCGAAPASEAGLCSDGIDNDCSGATDCADPDCAGDFVCTCVAEGGSCTSDFECCSDNCSSGNPATRVCLP